MDAVAATLLALLAVIALVLLLPWRADVTFATAPLRLRLALRPLNGLGPAIPVSRGTADRSRPRRPARTRKRARRRPRVRRLRGIGHLLSDLAAAIGVGGLSVSGRFGLSDPADTGTLYGLLQPLIVSGRAAGARIDVAPDFAAPCLDLTGRGTLTLRPARLAVAALRFGWTNRREVLA